MCENTHSKFNVCNNTCKKNQLAWGIKKFNTSRKNNYSTFECTWIGTSNIWQKSMIIINSGPKETNHNVEMRVHSYLLLTNEPHLQGLIVA